ncbi:hypothetical protein KKG41_04970 [Patescibacteria group bacterium]|nr:hypothetical protein [Patescibacteria group bacterium]MBU1890524.1 hypothetical protein [Patescibacteria group bacterium]
MSALDQVRKTILYIIFKNSKIVSVGIAVVILGLGTIFFLYPKYLGIQNQGLFEYDTKQELLDNRQSYLDQLNKMVDEFNKINEQDVENLKKILPSGEQIPELFVMADQLGKDMNMQVNSINISTQSAVKQAVTVKDNKTISANTGDSKSWTYASQPGTEAANVYSSTTSLGTANITISVVAEEYSYAKFKEMLNTIENSMRIFDLKSVSYTSGGNALSLNLTTYFIDSI